MWVPCLWPINTASCVVTAADHHLAAGQANPEKDESGAQHSHGRLRQKNADRENQSLTPRPELRCHEPPRPPLLSRLTARAALNRILVNLRQGPGFLPLTVVLRTPCIAGLRLSCARREGFAGEAEPSVRSGFGSPIYSRTSHSPRSATRFHTKQLPNKSRPCIPVTTRSNPSQPVASPASKAQLADRGRETGLRNILLTSPHPPPNRPRCSLPAQSTTGDRISRSSSLPSWAVACHALPTGCLLSSLSRAVPYRQADFSFCLLTTDVLTLCPATVRGYPATTTPALRPHTRPILLGVTAHLPLRARPSDLRRRLPRPHFLLPPSPNRFTTSNLSNSPDNTELRSTQSPEWWRRQTAYAEESEESESFSS